VQAAISKPKTKIERIAFCPVVSFRCDAMWCAGGAAPLKDNSQSPWQGCAKQLLAVSIFAGLPVVPLQARFNGLFFGDDIGTAAPVIGFGIRQ
jgi:hypothetical protein